MNQTMHINLGGYSFVMDIDAYDLLDEYITSLERHFLHEEGATEILSDIEARMAELFREKLKGSEIVTKKIVSSTIHQMGDASFFEDEHTHEEVLDDRSAGISAGKRLYRDPEDKILGGVCSGIAQYFGVEDPLWIRLFFVVLNIAGGSSFVLYVLLWIIVPIAKTRSERLAMRGEPINIDSIVRSVQDELDDIQDSLSSLKQKVKEEMDFDELNDFHEIKDVFKRYKKKVKNNRSCWCPWDTFRSYPK